MLLKTLFSCRQLLQDCGIGNSELQSTDIVINQHRALVFCQLKAMLDIIENDLFKRHMPTVTYLRLDGSIPPGQRHSVVTRFVIFFLQSKFNYTTSFLFVQIQQ